ncbi:hypothetical protein P3342_005908 [Pyrenophora teres f. teres]|nr:hypothetical protein P3342_005908 [Pyrenophora teres f. teres]
MSKAKRPPTSGYARIAQAEEEEDSSSDVEGDHHQNSLSNSQYVPIQPQRNAGMRVNGSGANSPNHKVLSGRRQRSNSGVDIKAINARFERWADEIAQKFKIKKQKDSAEDDPLEIHHSVFHAPDWLRPATAESLTLDYDVPSDRMTKLEFDDIVESVRTAIEMEVHPS